MKIMLKLFITFFKIGAFTFGGGYAMIPFIQSEIVEKNKWIKDEEMVDLLALAQSLPGAVAINCSTFVGYRIAGTKGAFMATLGVVLPSFLIILGLSGLLLKYGNTKNVSDFLLGINTVLVALILFTVYKLVNSSIKDMTGWLIAIIGFLLLLVFKIHPVFVIIAAALTGIFIKKTGGNKTKV